MRGTTVKPQISPSMFPKPGCLDLDTTQHQSNMSKRRIDTAKASRKPSATSDDFGDDDLDDETLVKAVAGDLGFDHIENYADPFDSWNRKVTTTNKPNKKNSGGKETPKVLEASAEDNEQDSMQLANGKWACNHACKDKEACKHFCCKNGMDKPPKKKLVTKCVPSGEKRLQPQQKTPVSKGRERQTKLQIPTSKRKLSASVEELDLTQQEKKKSIDYRKNGSRDCHDLRQLHDTVQGKDLPSSLHSVMHTKPAYYYSIGGEHNLTFVNDRTMEQARTPSDYGSIQFEDSPPHPGHSHHAPVQQGSFQPGIELAQRDCMSYEATTAVLSHGSETYGDDDSLLGDAMIGLVDSQIPQRAKQSDMDVVQPLEEAPEYADEMGHEEYDAEVYDDFTEYERSLGNGPQEVRYADENLQSVNTLTKNSPSLFVNSMSSIQAKHDDFKPAKTMHQGTESRNVAPQNALSPPSRPSMDSQSALFEEDDLDDLDTVECEHREDNLAKETSVSEGFRGLEPWLFQEFGDIVELVEE